jgi:Zn-dependent protease
MNGNDEDVLQPQPKVPSEQAEPTQPSYLGQPSADIPPYTAEQERRAKQEVEELRRKVGRFFSVYDIRVGLDALAFHVRVNEDTLEENFENLRNLLRPDYIPMLTYEGGEHIIYILRKPKAKYKSVRVNIIMLFITIISTTISGSLLWTSYDAAIAGIPASEIDGLSIFSPVNLLFGGLFFSLPLLLILGTHEIGHYIMAKKHGVAASLPFFIPMLPPLGTLGAVISMREPIPNKKALIDIGAAGPIAGLVIAIPVTILGFMLTGYYNAPVQPNEPGGLILYNPLLLIGLSQLFPIEGEVLAHPTFFAGWVGILVTALNLLPAGQLDGGHIVRALFGDKTRYIGISTVIIMFFLGFAFNYFGYVFLIVIVMVLGGGLGHPPPLNDVTKLDGRRIMVGVVALLIFVVSFHPAPIQSAELPKYGFDMETEFNETVVIPGNFRDFSITITNTGNIENEAFLNATMNQTKIDSGWEVSLVWITDETVNTFNITDIGPLNLTVEEKEAVNVTATVFVPATALSQENVTITFNLVWISWELNQYSEVVQRHKNKVKPVIIKIL